MQGEAQPLLEEAPLLHVAAQANAALAAARVQLPPLLLPPAGRVHRGGSHGHRDLPGGGDARVGGPEAPAPPAAGAAVGSSATWEPDRVIPAASAAPAPSPPRLTLRRVDRRAAGGSETGSRPNNGRT